MRHRFLAALAAAVFVCVQATPGAGPSPRPVFASLSESPGIAQQASPGTSQGPFLHVSALDGRSRPVLDLKASDFVVNVDGRPRRISNVEYLSGGRSVVLLADERSVDPALTPMLRAVVTQTLDGFTPADRIGVIPIASGLSSVTLSTDPRAPRAAAATLSGRRATPAEGAMTLVEAQQVLRGDRQTIADLIARAGHQAQSDRRVEDRTEEERRQQEEERRSVSAGTLTVPPELAAEAEVLVRDARRIATDAIAAATGAVALLKDGTAPRAVVLFTGTATIDPTTADAKALATTAADASTPLFVVHLSATGRPEVAARSIAEWAAATGGGLVQARGRVADLARIQGTLAATYRVTLEPVDADREARLRDVTVTTTRRDVSVGAATRWQPHWEVAAAVPESPSAPPVLPTPPGTLARDRRASRARVAPNPVVLAVLARAASYVDGYEREFSSVVAEEVYEQRIPGGEKRKLRSDYLLVKQPGDEAWVPFRDVFEVDGAPIRDREERLKRLFLEAPAPAAVKEATRITEESSRYNIGTVYRTINVPTLPLMFLAGAAQPRFEFVKAGEETIEGVAVWRIDFREIEHPTFIHTREGGDVPATGSVWIDPVNGRVVRTALVSALVTKAGQGIRMEAIVTYRSNQALGIWVPVQMRETYSVPRSAYTPQDWEEVSKRVAQTAIVATATYSNFRRFQVITSEKVKDPN